MPRDTTHAGSGQPSPDRDGAGQVPLLSASDHARVLTRILLSPVVKGPIVRRPGPVNLVERFDLDSAGVREMQRLHERYGDGPVQLRIPGRRLALVLAPADVHRVLDGTPEPFTPATLEKRGALNHFEPESSLVSSAQERRARRPLNEEVLESSRPVHSHAEVMTAAIEREVTSLLGHADFTGTLDWDGFATAWWRIVRQIVLGAAAREDHQITDDIRRLRRRANLAYAMPQNRRLRESFLAQLRRYVEAAEPGSLAEMVARTPASRDAEPIQQIPQWLFAFDAAAWATFRALSLLTCHPGAAETAREEMTRAPELPYLRATVLESLRLWPTTPLLLRDTTEETTWRTGSLPAGTAVIIFAPYFHRDERHLAEAHRFAPQLWLEGHEPGERDDRAWPLVPFSDGPGICPGRNVVLLTCSMVLGELVRQRSLTAQQPLDTSTLPGSLSPFSSRFTVAPLG
ncbi:cytochrome P450 [Brachybacterium sp. GCM10030268]|uniref:cytochrome P450 n=1 Tax=Brachybacterium sp. GCM10030268 TaxID=3273382 RepID=UPI003621FF6B